MEPWDDFWAAPHAGGACAPVPRPRPRGQANPPGGRSPQNVHLRNLTWNLKISPWKRKDHLETISFRFHVKFRGCSEKQGNPDPKMAGPKHSG